MAVRVTHDRVGNGVIVAKEVSQPFPAGGANLGAAGPERLVAFHLSTEVALMTYGPAVPGQMWRHETFGTIVHHPVFAAIRIDPDGRHVAFGLGPLLLRLSPSGTGCHDKAQGQDTHHLENSRHGLCPSFI